MDQTSNFIKRKMPSPRVSRENFCQVLQRWTALLGEENISVDDATLDYYSRDTGLKSNLPSAIIKPSSKEQLQQVLVIASQHRIPIYCISRGKNWAYGSASPVAEKSVVVDLSQMNKILEVNTELAYAVIEPGVTQIQLFNYLLENNIPLSMDVTGSTPDSSLIGNILERGYGQSPYGDRFQHCSSMEVLLSDGTFLKTGFGHYKNSKSHSLYKWGIGPHLDGLFTQSNFGIVTSLTFWLMPIQEEISLMTLSIESDEKLVKCLTVLRDLKLRGLLPSTVHVSNEYRVLSCFEQYPFEKANGKEPLPSEIKNPLMKKRGIARWNCFTSLRGSSAQVALSFKEIRQAVKGVAKADLISKRSVWFADNLPLISKIRTKREPEQTKLLFSLVSGRPSIGPTLGLYWRKKNAAKLSDLDPLRDRCGLIWCAPVLPNTKVEIEKFLELASDILTKFGFETNLTFTLLSERALCSTVGIFYDQENKEETVRANDCYNTCLRQFVVNGYYPYRHGINVKEVEEILFDESDSFWKTCQILKDTFDPQHILSPGKYNLW